jgi:hypothetical protein
MIINMITKNTGKAEKRRHHKVLFTPYSQSGLSYTIYTVFYTIYTIYTYFTLKMG